MRKVIILQTIGILFFFGLTPCYPGDDVQLPKGLQGISVGGQWFLSYYNGRSSGVSYNRFAIKRAYINVHKSFNDWLSGRITPDAHQDAAGNFMVRLKYAYADFKLPDMGLLYKPHIEWGMVHRTWLDFEEHVNYYRLQDPMFLERNDLFNSADIGATFFTLLGGETDREYQKNVNSKYPGRYGSIAIGVYNGGGYHAKENNTKKELEARITLRPLPDILPGLQFSYFGVYGHSNVAAAPAWNVNTGFVSYEHKRFVLTGTYYAGKGTQSGEVDSTGVSLNKNGYSMFGELKFPDQKISLIGRYDKFDYNTDVDNSVQTRVILGLAIHLSGHNKILFDYDVTSYADPGKVNDPRFQVTAEISF